VASKKWKICPSQIIAFTNTVKLSDANYRAIKSPVRNHIFEQRSCGYSIQSGGENSQGWQTYSGRAFKW